MACYNSADTIVDSIKSLKNRVDLILCFDAKWNGFPYPSLYSDDDTEDLINCLKKTENIPVQYIRLPSPIDQVTMRSMMLDFVPNGEWIFNIDADEYVTHWSGVKEVLNAIPERGFRICQKFQRPYCATTTLRLIKKTTGLKYTNNHREVEDENGLVDVHRFPVLINVVIDHLAGSEHKRMRPYMEKYKDWLFLWESNHRKI